MSPHPRRAKPRWLRGWAPFVSLVAAGAGLMFATSAETSAGTDLRSSGRSDLVDVVRAQDRVVSHRVQSVQQLQTQVDDLTAVAAPGNVAVARMRAASAKLATAAGAEAVAGPALTVTLDDAHAAANLPKGYSMDYLVVHQQDVQNVANALWAAGAEAMMLQDQRVISTSAVRCVGNTLILQGRVYSPPYVIQAIGDLPAMRIGLDNDQQVRAYRRDVALIGLGYDVASTNRAVFPAYAGNLGLLHARTKK